MRNSQDDRKWRDWLISGRFGGSALARASGTSILHSIRDRILSSSDIGKGDIVLDAGCGNGLLGLGVLEQYGESAKCVFLDSSADVLEVVRNECNSKGVSHAAQFVCGFIEDMVKVQDASIDVVLIRSVLSYVSAKSQAFKECYRVLNVGGRISICEPINKFQLLSFGKQNLFGVDLIPLGTLGAKVLDQYGLSDEINSNPMYDFDEQSLFEMAVRAGFQEIFLSFEVCFSKSIKFPPWDILIKSPPNPFLPSLEVAMERALTDEERKVFISYFRPIVEGNSFAGFQALCFLNAQKLSK